MGDLIAIHGKSKSVRKEPEYQDPAALPARYYPAEQYTAPAPVHYQPQTRFIEKYTGDDEPEDDYGEARDVQRTPVTTRLQKSQPSRSLEKRPQMRTRRPVEEPKEIDADDEYEEVYEDEEYVEFEGYTLKQRALRYMGALAIVWVGAGAVYTAGIAAEHEIGMGGDKPASVAMVVTGPADAISTVNNDLIKPMVGVGSTGLHVVSFIKNRL